MEQVKQTETKHGVYFANLEAYNQGIKTLYYMRTESVLRGDIAKAAVDPDCISCDG